MEQRVRIRDIAEELGLSTATVSNVIHGKTRKISDQTVCRVMALLEERQYIPNIAGVLLAQNASRIIGVFLNDHEKYEGHTLDDCFISTALNALSTEIEQSGQFMMIKKAKTVDEIIRFASMWNMDGLVVIGFCAQDYHALRSHMRIPFVVYDGGGADTERVFNICIDDADGGEQVGRHLRHLGHRRALCIADNNEEIDHARMEGFRRGFEGSVEQMLVPMQQAQRWEFYRSQRARFREATAAFAVSDYYAMDLIRFLSGEGIAVPEAFSVAGFDDIPMARMFRPALTTVQQDSARRAALAISKLRELRAGDCTENRRILPVTLMIRESTGLCPK